MELHFAPLQGYADHLYRRFHAAVYGAADYYYTPFIRIEKGSPRRQDIARLKESANDGTNLIPQIIFNSVREFDELTAAVKDAGYNRIDLNLGCPFPMQTGKGRGAAMITDLDTMRSVIDKIIADNETTYSVKMRLGLSDPNEWQSLMPILNKAELAHITIHPRVAEQMYSGQLHTNQIEQILKQSSNPIIYNGDILTIDDMKRIEDIPGIKGVMVGRGMLARPSLFEEWKNGEWTHEERLEKLLLFHNDLCNAYESTLCGQTQILQKIKPFWEYLEPEIGHKACKAIRKAVTLPKYHTAIGNIK